MYPEFSLRALRPVGSAVAAILIATVSGCGPGSAPEGWGVEDGHGDMVIASTAPGAGQLAIEYDFAEAVELGAPQCIGGDGDECLGGIVLFGSESPGFDVLFEDEPEESLYALPEGVEVSLELIDHSPEASFFIDGTSLNTPGASVVLGESLEGLHVHGEFQLAFPGGTEPEGDFFLRFRLVTASPAFAASEEYVLTLHAHEDHEDEEHDDDHDHEDDHEDEDEHDGHDH